MRQGIDGGAGHDRIVNTGPVTANATSDADVSSVAVTVGAAVSAGASFGDASVVSNTAARGIAGGEGNDEIYNEGKIILRGHVPGRCGFRLRQRRHGVGRSDDRRRVGDDGLGHRGRRRATTRIVNKGEIRVGPSPGLDPWMSRITANSFTFGLAGVANAQSSMLATTRSTGIDGGAGNDRIHNEGLLNVLRQLDQCRFCRLRIIFGASSGAVRPVRLPRPWASGRGGKRLHHEHRDDHRELHRIRSSRKLLLQLRGHRGHRGPGGIDFALHGDFRGRRVGLHPQRRQPVR